MTEKKRILKTQINLNKKIEITINQQQTIFNDIELYETIDIDILKYLINSDILQTIKPKKSNKSYTNHKTHLEHYMKNYLRMRKVVKVNYGDTNIGYGRVSACKGLSLGNLKKEIRYILAYENYVDIDIVNCHPNIIYQICISNNIPCPFLTKYIYNRETILQETMKFYNINRDQSKDLFIRLMYGSSFNTWAEEFKIHKKATKFINNFLDEFHILSNIIIGKNIELETIIKKMKSKKNEIYHIGCTMSYYAQEYERRILEYIYLYMKNNNIIDNNCVLCFDGIMIPKENFYENLLEELSNEIYNKMGFKLKFEEKKNGR